MSFIERAAKRLEQRHLGVVDDVRRDFPGRLPQVSAEPEPLEHEVEAELSDTGRLAGSPGTAEPEVANTKDTESRLDEPGRVPSSVDEPADTDSDLNDEALGQNDVDTYTGAVFRNSTDRVRAAHVRALRAKIDQVEASVDEATVSMPPAPVRAARVAAAGAAGAGAAVDAAGDDQPPVLSMRNMVRDSALAENVPADQSARALAPDSGAAAGDESSATNDSPAASLAPPAPGTGGKLSLSALQAQAYLDPDGREDPMREAFEPIADDLLEQMAADAAASTPMGRRILVTSAEHGVGRSLCGVHMALSLVVDHGQSVCYIDLDFSGTPILPSLGVRAGVGVADWLDGQVQTIDALVVPTELAGLKLIGPGSPGPVSRRAQRLDRQSTVAFLLAYSARYPEDLVVMGAPALEDEWNATMLAGLAGQVVVVVEANKTSRRQLGEALEALQRHSRVSLVLNKMKR